jgi:hypothetical protein
MPNRFAGFLHNWGLFSMVALYASLLNWSPYTNGFLVYVFAIVTIAYMFLRRGAALASLKTPEFYYFSFPALLYAAGLLWADAPNARTFEIVAPILVFGLAYTTFPKLDAFKTRVIIVIFVASTSLCAIFSVLYYLYSSPTFDNPREMSIFMSYIRFSLFANIAIFSSIYYLIWCKSSSYSKLEKHVFISGLIILVLFILVLQSLTGLVIMVAGLVFIFLQYFRNKRSGRKRALFLSGISLLFTGLVLVSYHEAKGFIWPKDSLENLPQATASGRLYKHYTFRPNIENGHYVYINLCHEELVQEWAKRSHISLDGLDARNQPIYSTLIRYITSMGYAKDSAGISKLGQDDITYIENGIANYRYAKGFLINTKIYTFFWELHSAKNGLDPSGHSAVQRIIFLRAGLELIKDNFWYGVGTVNLGNTLKPYYEQIGTSLHSIYWHNPHNQFVSIFCYFGLIGFLLFIASFVLLICRTNAISSFFKSTFLLVLFLSMLTEDTILAQAGVVLHAFIGGLFMLGTELTYPFLRKPEPAN